LTVLDNRWVNDHLIQLIVSAATALSRYLKTASWKKWAITYLMTLDQLKASTALVKKSGW
jgi:hypothetical protein